MQERAVQPESADDDERAGINESTAIRERAVLQESAVDAERAEYCESTRRA